MPSFVVEGSNIADLEVAPDSSFPAPVESNDNRAIPSSTFAHPTGPDYEALGTPEQPQSLPIRNAKLPPQEPPKQSHVDPAILSFIKPLNWSNGTSDIYATGKRPTLSGNVPEKPALAVGTTAAKPPVPTQTKPIIPTSTALPVYNTSGLESQVVAVRARPLDEMTMDRGAEGLDVLEGLAVADGPVTKEIMDSMGPVPVGRQTAQPLEAPVKYTGKRSRRGARGRSQKEAAMQIPMMATHGAQDPDSSPGAVRRGGRPPKGWRQTPLTEPSSATKSQPPTNGSVSRQPASASKRKSRNPHRKNGEEQNGWATEEATDIQDMGDFDFEGNLSKFDKRGVFDQIRHDDTTADEERLVSFNRLPARPGTNGGKNLHYTENVLDSPVATGSANWNSEAGDSEDDDAQINSGRSSRRTLSRATMRRPPSRKSSAVASTSQQAGGAGLRYSSPHHTGSPNLKANRKVPSISGSMNSSKPSLRMISSGRACPCVSPLQMLEIEQLAISELGMTEDMITENAGRGIAELALRIVGRDVQDSSKESQPASPVIVILAGNHKSGARAIAAGRHLRSHSTRVSICVLGLEREDDLVDSVRRQLQIFRKSGGRVIQDSELPRFNKANNAPKELLVVEALLSTHVTFDDLRVDDQARYLELNAWAYNWSEQTCHIISVDVPSGVDASSGAFPLSLDPISPLSY